MLDLLVLVAGMAVGALAIVGINGVRRGSRPVPVVGDHQGRSRPAPPSRPAPDWSGRPSPVDHGIRVNHPGVQAPPQQAPQPSQPPPAPPATAAATAVASSPSLTKRPSGAGAGRPRLELEDGSDGVDLADEPVTIGRGADQRLRIKDTRASRAHAVVRPRSKGRTGWEVEDQGSANGTELNGHRIPDGRVAPLQDGDRIGIGSAVIVYAEGGGDRPPSGPAPSGASADPDATRIGP